MSISGNWDRRISRKAFIGAGGLGAAALLMGSGVAGARPKGSAGYGALVEDPGGMIDLPRGFQYRVISEQGTKLSSGAPVPGDHDGMAAFAGRGNTTVLVRNHELRPSDMGSGDAPVPQKNPYSAAAPGGTTGIVVGPNRKEIRDYVTSSGTLNNCAGGATPWGTWLTCEEDRTTGHGYVFEVDPNNPENDISKTPIREMGFFSHEAVDIDPQTGIAYLTEDDFRGQIPDDATTGEDNFEEKDENGNYLTRSSFLYRYVPGPGFRPRPGGLLASQEGSKLQVLTVQDRPSYNVDLATPRQSFQVRWVDVSPEEPHEDAVAKGGARFNRLEGAYFAGGAFWFDDTAGGEKRLGQIFRYLPATNTLELFYEGTSANKMESPDNIVVTPWGDLWFAEDGDGENRVMGITPEGQVYKFASNRVPYPGGESGEFSEFAGPTFTPDGKTFFVNIQNPGITFAIWGPFGRRNAARQRQMAVAAPPAHLAPSVSGELAEAAERHGMSTLEAAAFERLGVSLV